MAHELQLIKQSSGILIPATPETSDILQSKIKLGTVLVAEFRQVRNPAFHRRFFALLNLGFEYWEPTGGAISSNERKLVTGYAKFLAAFGGNEGALLDAASNPATTTRYNCLTAPFANIPAALLSPTWTKPNSSSCTKPRSMFCGAEYCPGHSRLSVKRKTPQRS